MAKKPKTRKLVLVDLKPKPRSKPYKLRVVNFDEMAADLLHAHRRIDALEGIIERLRKGREAE